MTGPDKFSHGLHYGDYSGVVWTGSPTEGSRRDRLAVSNCYINPLFSSILDRFWKELAVEQAPRLALEWNTLEGWVAASGPVPVNDRDAAEFADALAHLGPTDVVEHCAGCTVDDCLECAKAVREFIDDHLTRGAGLFIEVD